MAISQGPKRLEKSLCSLVSVAALQVDGRWGTPPSHSALALRRRLGIASTRGWSLKAPWQEVTSEMRKGASLERSG